MTQRYDGHRFTVRIHLDLFRSFFKPNIENLIPDLVSDKTDVAEFLINKGARRGVW